MTIFIFPIAFTTSVGCYFYYIELILYFFSLLQAKEKNKKIPQKRRKLNKSDDYKKIENSEQAMFYHFKIRKIEILL